MTRPNDVAEVAICEILVREERAGGDERTELDLAYQAKMGRLPIYLSPIEFRILCFLSAKPYRPYTRRKIAQAVSNEEIMLAAEGVDEQIASLREKLGFFRDYIQAVPYIGYRFKA